MGVFSPSLALKNPNLPPIPLMGHHYQAGMLHDTGMLFLEYMDSNEPNIVCFIDDESKKHSPFPIPSAEEESVIGYRTIKDYLILSLDRNGLQHDPADHELLSNYFDEIMDYCRVNELFNFDKFQEGM